MKWVAISVVIGLLAALTYWLFRRRRRSRLIAFVALTREAVNFDPAVLASVAGKAWKADLGDGSSEGTDGFVTGIGVMNTIVCDDRMFLVNCFPKPYTDDLESAAQGIPDLRIRKLFLEHQAWFSCDAMGVDGRTSQEEVADWYRRLGQLFVELLDDNCLLIYLPDSGLAFPINEETESADPLEALQGTLTVPVIEVSSDDPLMKQAVEKARQRWPEFVAAYEKSAYEKSAGENFAVKGPVTHSNNTEFIWITVTALEGDRIFGQLANDPANLGLLKLGSKVTLPVANLNDWCYMDSKGNLVGGFTIEAVQKASRRGRK